MDRGRYGFHYDGWDQSLKGHEHSRALAILQPEEAAPYCCACATPEQGLDLMSWADAHLGESGLPVQSGRRALIFHSPMGPLLRLEPSAEVEPAPALFNIAAYSPSLALRRLRGPSLASRVAPNHNCLSFDQTVHSETVQSWLLNIDYERAKALERSRSAEQYTRSLARFEAALSEIYDERVKFEVEFDPDPEPRLKIRGQSLIFRSFPTEYATRWAG